MKQLILVSLAGLFISLQVLANDLIGTWQTGCVGTSTGKESQEITFKNDGTLERKFILHNDKYCRSNEFTGKLIAQYYVGDINTEAMAKNSAVTTTEISDLNLQFQNLFLRPDNPGLAKWYNDMEYCENKEWNPMHFFEVTGLDCKYKQYMPAGTLYFDVYTILQSGELLLAKGEKGRGGFGKADQRRISLDTNLVFHRK